MEVFIDFFMVDGITYVIHLLEIMGVIVITIGGLKAFYKYVKALILRQPDTAKLAFLNAMAVALEFKLGAEILKTTLVKDLNEIFMLGSIILLRALMSVFIHWEIRQSTKGEV